MAASRKPVKCREDHASTLIFLGRPSYTEVLAAWKLCSGEKGKLRTDESFKAFVYSTAMKKNIIEKYQRAEEIF